MSNNIFPQEAIDLFSNLFENNNKKSIWTIEINGKRVSVSNGKQVWATKGHAKSALSNMIKKSRLSYNSNYTNDLSYQSDYFIGHLFKIMECRVLTVKDNHKDLNMLYKRFISEMEDIGVLKFKEIKDERPSQQ